MSIFHGATVDQIGTGDVLVLRSTVNGVETQSATTMGFAFSTPPAYASYDDGQGNSASFSYETVPCVASPCTEPISARPDGDVVANLSVWRPQRSRLESDPGQGKWIDIGSLTYLFHLGLHRDDTLDYGGCPQESLSESDLNLASPPREQLPFRMAATMATGEGSWILRPTSRRIPRTRSDSP